MNWPNGSGGGSPAGYRDVGETSEWNHNMNRIADAKRRLLAYRGPHQERCIAKAIELTRREAQGRMIGGGDN